ncbi:TPA: RraA family protein [Legionella bozemanae]
MKLKIEHSYVEICKRLSQLTTPLICDALPSVRLMDSDIHSFNTSPQTRIVGRAYTVNSAQDSLSTMQALDDLPDFMLALGCSDDRVPILLVIASCGTKLAVAGGMCADVAKTKGFGGIITDGNCRDVSEIRTTNIPFFAKGQCAKSGSKNKIGSIRKPINCGSVEVNPGELIFADEDGIIVMNKEEAVNAINKAEEIKEKEAAALTRIHEGARFDEICNLKEHMEKLENNEASSLKLTV